MSSWSTCWIARSTFAFGPPIGSIGASGITWVPPKHALNLVTLQTTSETSTGVFLSARDERRTESSVELAPVGLMVLVGAGTQWLNHPATWIEPDASRATNDLAGNGSFFAIDAFAKEFSD